MTPKPRWRSGAALAAVVLSLLGLAAPAGAERVHEVRAGQTLWQISKRYHVSLSALAAANRLKPSTPLRPGQQLSVPGARGVFVGKGDTLSRLARRHGVSVSTLRTLNHLKKDASIRVGQHLRLPGGRGRGRAERADDDGVGPGRGRRAQSAEQGRRGPRFRGRLTLQTMPQGRRVHLDLRRPGSPAWRRSLHQLRRIMGHRRGRPIPRPHPRLLRVLRSVGQRFGGRTVYIISGYRPAGGHTRRTSKHTRSRALDLRVQGVSNRALRNHLRRLANVGVGYYPNSYHVHVDVRGHRAYWVDLSGPGQAPRYVRKRRRQAERSKAAARADAQAHKAGSPGATKDKTQALPGGAPPSAAARHASASGAAERAILDQAKAAAAAMAEAE
ncbi:MAG: LysM peptidoglycan-binding domain-containing protein [Polyangiales bacterium]